MKNVTSIKHPISTLNENQNIKPCWDFLLQHPWPARDADLATYGMFERYLPRYWATSYVLTTLKRFKMGLVVHSSLLQCRMWKCLENYTTTPVSFIISKSPRLLKSFMDSWRTEAHGGWILKSYWSGVGQLGQLFKSKHGFIRVHLFWYCFGSNITLTVTCVADVLHTQDE